MNTIHSNQLVCVLLLTSFFMTQQVIADVIMLFQAEEAISIFV